MAADAVHAAALRTTADPLRGGFNPPIRELFEHSAPATRGGVSLMRTALTRMGFTDGLHRRASPMAFTSHSADTDGMTSSSPPPPPPPPPPRRMPRAETTGSAGSTSSTTSSTTVALKKSVAVAGRVKGVFLIVTLLILFAATFFIAPLLGATFEREGLKISGWPGLFFTHPWIVLPLSLPALASAVALIRGVKRPIFWIMVSTALLVPPTAFVLLGVVGGWMQLLDSAMNLR